MFTLETERLVLRDFVPGDFDAFYATTQDPEYRRFYAEAEMTRAFWRDLLDRIIAGAAASPRTAYQLAICLPGGELIGTCGVRLESAEQRQASFGCAIARAHWGRGYALEASRRIIDYGFANLPIHRLYAEVIAENSRARALAERLGLRLEGELRHTRYFRGRWWNTAIYGILEGEWRRIQPSLSL
ncbi:MAG: GNAT family N-acetyltransferase [Anaerolineae bacterium]